MTTRVELQWDKNTESDLAGYKVTWETDEPGNHHAILLQRDVTNITLDVILKRKKLYTFSVSAFDGAGNESKPTRLKAWYKD